MNSFRDLRKVCCVIDKYREDLLDIPSTDALTHRVTSHFVGMVWERA